jgi:trigger factor
MDVNVKIEDVSSVKKKISFEVPWEEVKNELDSAYVKIGKQAKVKGFRPGKTPRKILEAHYNDQAEGEAISNIINKYYWDEIEKRKIEPTSQPTIDQSGIKLESEFTFSATIDIKPIIDPKDYLELELDKKELRITDKDVDKRLEELRDTYSTLEDVTEERPIVNGDFPKIDFRGSVDGKELDSMKSENYLLEIGSKRFIPGFEDELIGLKVGDSKEFNIKFPEKYSSEDLAGKEATFNVTIKGLKQKKMPELDEDFMKNFDKFESLESLKENIRQSLEQEFKSRGEAEFRNQLIDKLLEKNTFEVPETLVDRQLYMMIMNVQQRMAYSGMDPQKAAELSYRMRDNMKGDAEKQVKASLLLEAIGKKESIQADKEAIDQKLEELAKRFATDIEVIKKSYQKEDMLESLKAEIVEQKTLAFIEAQAKINLVSENVE